MNALKLKVAIGRAGEWSAAQFAIAVLGLIRLLPFEPTANALSRLARFLAPILPRSDVAMENLRLAFPDMDEARRKEILRGMWDNFFRSLVEFVHLEKVIQLDPSQADPGRVEIVAHKQFYELRDSGEAAIIFTGHLANWEIMPISAAKLGLKVTSVFRPPNNRYVAEYLLKARSTNAGSLLPTMAGAGYEIMGILERGGIVGQLVDQRFRRGVNVPFFGHPAKTNTFPAKLARQYNCAVYGARAIRLPGSRFRIEMTDRIELPRDAGGNIIIEAATAKITSVVEDWVRQHPEQWLWVHRRWNP